MVDTELQEYVVINVKELHVATYNIFVVYPKGTFIPPDDKMFTCDMSSQHRQDDTCYIYCLSLIGFLSDAKMSHVTTKARRSHLAFCNKHIRFI